MQVSYKEPLQHGLVLLGQSRVADEGVARKAAALAWSSTGAASAECTRFACCAASLPQLPLGRAAGLWRGGVTEGSSAELPQGG